MKKNLKKKKKFSKGRNKTIFLLYLSKINIFLIKNLKNFEINKKITLSLIT